MTQATGSALFFMPLLTFKTWDLCLSVLCLQPFWSHWSRQLQQDDIGVVFYYNATLFLLFVYPKVPWIAAYETAGS